MQQTTGQAGFGMFFMFGTFDLMMFVFVWFFVPETKGLSLESMDERFGVVDDASTKSVEKRRRPESRPFTRATLKKADPPHAGRLSRLPGCYDLTLRSQDHRPCGPGRQDGSGVILSWLHSEEVHEHSMNMFKSGS
jgi:hypothetical protein